MTKFTLQGDLKRLEALRQDPSIAECSTEEFEGQALIVYRYEVCPSDEDGEPFSKYPLVLEFVPLPVNHLLEPVYAFAVDECWWEIQGMSDWHIGTMSDIVELCTARIQHLSATCPLYQEG